MKLMNPLGVDLGKRLISVNRSLQAKNNAVLHKQDLMNNEAKKLVREATAEMKASEMVDAGKLLGVDYTLNEAFKIKYRQEQMAAQYGHLKQERIFNIKAIEKVCRRYGLRFLPSPLYKGAMDNGIPDAIQSFKADNGGKIPEFNAHMKGYYHRGPLFMVAAPKESFALQKRPIDPLLFICIDGVGEEFYLIHKWGNDLAFYRPFMNWMGEWYMAGGAIVSILSGIALDLALKPSAFGFSEEQTSALASIVIGAIACIMFAHSNHDDPDKWNSPFKE